MMDQDPPLYTWVLSVNREVTDEEFNQCMKCLDSESVARINSIERREDRLRSMLGRLVPHVVMKQRGIPRSDWSIKTTKHGKPYIDAPDEEKAMGYNISRDGSLVAMAFSLGPRNRVWNVGVDVRRIMPPRGVRVRDFLESLKHKLTPKELSFLDAEYPDDVVLRRIFILWTLKESYTKALGQPRGFDFRRIQCDIPKETITVDGERLRGWEFRLFKANVGIMRKNILHEEAYQCVCAVYRGGSDTRFLWSEKPRELDKWLRFVTVDSIIQAATSQLMS